MDAAVQCESATSSRLEGAYRQYGQMAYFVALKILGKPDLAEEAVQEAFLRACRASASFDTGREMAPWIATIARRVAVDILRREQRRRHVDINNAPNEPALVSVCPGIEQAFNVWQTRQAIDSLPLDERTIVELQYRWGCTQQEIAEKLRLPIGTVKSRSFRAHHRLLDQLGHLREGVVAGNRWPPRRFQAKRRPSSSTTGNL